MLIALCIQCCNNYHGFEGLSVKTVQFTRAKPERAVYRSIIPMIPWYN